MSLLSDMDCDGLKKALLTDTDGTLLGQPSTVFSQAEYLWGKLKLTPTLILLICHIDSLNR